MNNVSSSKRILRDAIIKDLLQDIESGTSRNVFGLPQSGKTIVAQSIRESFDKSGSSKFHRKVILFDTSSSYGGFWKQMLSPFGVDMVDGASARKCFADEVSAFLRRTKDGHVLVEVDNFHRIEEYGEEGRMLLADFKWLLDKFSSELGFSCLFFSRKPFRCIQPCDKDNDELADVVADYGIGVFSPDEVVELAGDRRLGEIVYNRTGGLPRLANIMCVKARSLKPNRCKLDEIEDAAKAEIHNFFVGLKAQLRKITICGTNLFEALVERECNPTNRIPFEVAEAIRNTGLGEDHLPDSMSLLADFIKREYRQSVVAEGDVATGIIRANAVSKSINGKKSQGQKPYILVDIDRCSVELLQQPDGSMTLNGVLFLLVVLSFNGFGESATPTQWKERIRKISEACDKLQSGERTPFAWCLVDIRTLNIYDKLRDIRDGIEKRLEASCGSACRLVPKSEKGRGENKNKEPANWKDFFCVKWAFRGVEFDDFPSSECPGKLAELFRP